jgi:hypothetical protein
MTTEQPSTFWWRLTGGLMGQSVLERLQQQTKKYQEEYQRQLRYDAPQMRALTQEMLAAQQAYIQALEEELASARKKILTLTSAAEYTER